MNDSWIIGVSQLNTKKLVLITPPTSILQLSSNLINEALHDASPDLSISDIDGLLSMFPKVVDRSIDETNRRPSLQIKYAKWLATKLDMFDPIQSKSFITKTVDYGGATPVSLCLQARDLISRGDAKCIAILLVQTPNSVDRKLWLKGSQNFFSSQLKEVNEFMENNGISDANAPPIAKLYDIYSQTFLSKFGKKYGITRKHLAMIPVLMWRNACLHPNAISFGNKKLANATVNTVLESRDIGCSVVKQYECARITDGGVCIILASKEFILEHKSIRMQRCLRIVAGNESTHCLKHVPYLENDYKSFAMFKSVRKCIVNDIDWFGLYDCYPIAFLYGLLSCGICDIETVARFLEEWYLESKKMPINTHGGLLGFGAPLNVPAGFSIVEGVMQLRNEVLGERQIVLDECKLRYRAIVIGNGGIFQHSAVILFEIEREVGMKAKL